MLSIIFYFVLYSATGDKPSKKMQPEADAPGANSEACGTLSETQRALVSEIMETWKSKGKSPIQMKKVGLILLVGNLIHDVCICHIRARPSTRVVK